MRQRIVTAVVVVAATGLVLFLLARVLENGMIFLPARYPNGVWDPQRLGVTVEEHYFRTADGLTLHAWWFPPQSDAAAQGLVTPGFAGGSGSTAGSSAAAGPSDDSVPVLLWAHGNAGNISGRALHAQALAQQGMAVFVFDYRGYGRSEGQPTEEGIYRDADAAYAYLTEQLGVPASRVVLFGRSLGSAPAARLATRVPHAGLVLISPFPTAARMARRMFGGLPVDVLIRARFPVRQWVAERSTPLLVMHGDRDEIIPIEYGREVFDAAAEPKQFIALPGAGHNDILMVSGRAYLEPLADFAHRVVTAAR